MPHCSPHVIIILPAQMHRKISTLGTKNYFHNFLIINYETAVKTHMGREKIQSSPNQLPGAMAGSEVGQISFWRKEKVLTNTSGCLAAGADTQSTHGGAALPTQACGSTCSSSSSPFPLEPSTVIYGALTTVLWWCCRSRARFPPGEPTVPAGNAGGGEECQPCTPCQPPNEWHWSMENHKGQLKWRNSTKGPFFSFPGST